MAESFDGRHLSIGEVLGMLLEEFPDVTISKIRFLESQGLIDPERTPAGYRKFDDEDVELLRVILREQKQNFLPLRVIKDRIDSGQIDPSGELANPEHRDDLQHRDDPQHRDIGVDDAGGDHPGYRAESDGDETAGAVGRHPAAGSAAIPFGSGALVGRSELCAMTRLTDAQVRELEQHGLLRPTGSGGAATYDEVAIRVGRACARLLAVGLDVRHLKGWRLSAEREASVFAQMIGPPGRRGDDGSLVSAERRLEALEELGAELRQALVVASRPPRL